MTDKEHIIVLGGTGFVGEALARCWPLDERPLTYLVHRSSPGWLDELGVTHTAVDLSNTSSVASAVRGASTVVNLLRPLGDGWYPKVLDVVLPAMEASGVVRCVHASSIDVYSGSTETKVTTSTAPAARNAYEREHVDAEKKIGSLFAEPVILRLGAVFGPGGKNIVSLAEEMASLQLGRLFVKRALYGRRRMHLVSLPTVCGAIKSAALSGAADAVINVTDDEVEENNFGFVQDTLAASFGRRPFSGMPSAPGIILDLVLGLRGLSPALARRRFDSDGLDRLQSPRGDFVKELKHYAHYLSQRSQGQTP